MSPRWIREDERRQTGRVFRFLFSGWSWSDIFITRNWKFIQKNYQHEWTVISYEFLIWGSRPMFHTEDSAVKNPSFWPFGQSIFHQQLVLLYFCGEPYFQKLSYWLPQTASDLPDFDRNITQKINNHNENFLPKSPSESTLNCFFKEKWTKWARRVGW